MDHLATKFNLGGFMCFNCKHPGHKIKDCRALVRPQEIEAEIHEFEILQGHILPLQNFALFFLIHGKPEIMNFILRLVSHFSVLQWDWKVIGSGIRKFLVRFLNPSHIDMTVKDGLVNFSNFSGYFTLWFKDLNAVNKYKEVYVWIRLLGFP